MDVKLEELFAQLMAPFDAAELKTRDQGGKQLTYYSARTVMNRLDDVLGPDNWSDKEEESDTTIVVSITITLPGGRRLTKRGRARKSPVLPRSPYTAQRIEDMAADPSDSRAKEKAERAEEMKYADAIQLADDRTYAEAFKRAGVKLGIGRYLYRDGVPKFARKHHTADFATATPPESRPQQAASSGSYSGPDRSPTEKTEPRAGTGWIYYWCKKIGEHYGSEFVDRTTAFAKKRDWPKEWKNWDRQQVATVMWLVAKKCKELPNYDGQMDWVTKPAGPDL